MLNDMVHLCLEALSVSIIRGARMDDRKPALHDNAFGLGIKLHIAFEATRVDYHGPPPA